jgi:cation diffusion facilitator CzcD-associated flavoprotein CzcO
LVGRRQHVSCLLTPNSVGPPVVAIIGAGIGGIGMAIRLKRAGRDDFVILEQADRIGGTWRDNTYPGCTCDIPSHLYSLSFAPKADWSRRYASQPEIHQYLEDCIDRFGLRPHLRLEVRLKKATFDNTDGLWRMQTDPGPELAARLLVLAIGMLHRPAIPALHGIESFSGAMFHSARWDHAVEMRGKRVAVIGTGASAVQLVPHVAEQAAHLVLFQRTPAWVLPKPDSPFGPRRRSAMRHVPLLRRTLRAWLYWSHEIRGVGLVRFPRLMAGPERQARSHAKRQIGDDELRKLLTPFDRMGCKRILLSDEFYPSLNRSNVQLVSAPIKRVLSDGLVTADGVEHRADILVFATGFQATDPIGPIEVVGRGGITLSAAWRDGAQAHLGLAVAGFPNLFLLGGPNTGLGHNSVLFMLEAQIRHVLRCLRLLRLRGAVSIEVRQGVQAAFARRLDGWMKRTVWLSGCRSWYLDRNGRNTTLWPGFSVGYWLRVQLISVRDYQLTRAERRRRFPAWARIRRRA